MIEAKIIGFGNALRGDDGVGAEVVGALRERGIEAEALDGDGTELMEAWRGFETVFLIDAMVSGADPGTIRRFDILRTHLPQGVFRSSSHQVGMAEAVELARLLGRLPPRLVLFGVEGCLFDYGAGLSPGVAQAVADLATQIQAELTI